MSAPTKIYLVLVALLVVVWMGLSTFVGATHRTLDKRASLAYRLRHANEFTAVLRGRVVVRDAGGGEVEAPEGALQVEVRSRAAADSRDVIVRLTEVRPDGVFEVIGLPYGSAAVSVRLGGGEIIWLLDDVRVGGDGVLDPRIDPIDLGDRLHRFSLHVLGPDGDPATTGRLAWRATAGLGDDQAFGGVAPIRDGVATFLTTSPMIDALCMAPGVRAELFEGLYGDDRIDLGPGIEVELHVEGSLPDSERWQVRAELLPVDLVPQVELEGGPGDLDPVWQFATLEGAVATIPVERAGTYRLRWRVVEHGRRHQKTIRLEDRELVDVPPRAGIAEVSRSFPMDAFVRRTSSRR